MKKWVFSPLDLIAPWFVCLLTAGLCFWGMVKALTVPGNGVGAGISGGVGLVFLLAIPAYYWVRADTRNPAFCIDTMGVIWGKINKPSKEMVSAWLEELTTFWLQKSVRPLSDQTVRVTIIQPTIDRALSGLAVICHDTDHFSIFGRMVCGYSFGRDVAIGYKPPGMDYTASLFRHEVSHHILDAAGVVGDEERHHRIFKEVGLGA
jgi:hypothetical protein